MSCERCATSIPCVSEAGKGLGRRDNCTAVAGFGAVGCPGEAPLAACVAPDAAAAGKLAADEGPVDALAPVAPLAPLVPLAPLAPLPPAAVCLSCGGAVRAASTAPGRASRAPWNSADAIVTRQTERKIELQDRGTRKTIISAA